MMVNVQTNAIKLNKSHNNISLNRANMIGWRPKVRRKRSNGLLLPSATTSPLSLRPAFKVALWILTLWNAIGHSYCIGKFYNR